MKGEAAVADEPDAAVETFEASVVEAEADRGEDPVAVTADGAGELYERLQPGAGGPGEPGVDVLGRERGIFELVEDAELFFEQEGSVDGRLACWTSPSFASWLIVCFSGLLSSDQRVPLIHLPAGVWERSWAFHSSRRTWSTARWARRTTWKGSKHTSAAGALARIAFS